MIFRGAVWKYRERRQTDTLFKRREIALEQRHTGINAIRHPSGKCRAVASNRLNTQQRLVKTAEPHADDQYHR